MAGTDRSNSTERSSHSSHSEGRERASEARDSLSDHAKEALSSSKTKDREAREVAAADASAALAAGQDRLAAEGRSAKERVERQIERMIADRSVDPMDDPDTMDRAVGKLDRFAATPEARATAANIANAHTHDMPNGLGMTDAQAYNTRDMAREISDMARRDPVGAMDVAAALNNQLPAHVSNDVFERVAEKVETSRRAEFTLDARAAFGPRADIDALEAQNAAGKVISNSQTVGVVGSWLGQGPSFDPELAAEKLVELRDINQDLAVAARREIVSSIDPRQADQLDAQLAELPVRQGVAVIGPITNPWQSNGLTRFAASVIGDPIAAVGSAFRKDGLGVNPLTRQILSERQLQDAKFMAVVDTATLGIGRGVSTAARGADEIIEVATETARRAAPAPAPGMLPTEGAVGTYDDLIAAGTKGDDITPHHIPSANRMAAENVDRGDAIAINMEHPFPGRGGRHRDTFTYGTQADINMIPREALAAGVRDMRQIYQREGLYNDYMRDSLQELIEMNKTRFPEIFNE